MKKLNLFKLILPCTSIDCVLGSNRTLAIDKTIKDAEDAYRSSHGDSLQMLSGYHMSGSRLVMEIWQMPKPEQTKKRFTDNACGGSVKKRG